MTYLIPFFLTLSMSMSYAQTLSEECAGDPTKCSQKHSEEDGHAHDDDHEDEHTASQDSPAEGAHAHKKENSKAPDAHHDHKEHDEKDAHNDEHKDGHAEHKDSHDEEGGEHEESTQVGPEKGILEANETGGFRLSPEATKNFKLKLLSFQKNPVSLPLDAILQTTEEKNVYRFRGGFYKRIEISVISKSKSEMTFSSDDLKSGDQIVVGGIGFLRIAELAAFGGAPEGHSH